MKWFRIIILGDYFSTRARLFYRLRYFLWLPDYLGEKGLDIWWHIHHEILYEHLREPIRNRINYVKITKPQEQIEMRLRIMKPILGEYPKTEEGWEELHKTECPNCTWDAEKKTIFPI